MNGREAPKTRLPERYREDWRQPFVDRALRAIPDDAHVLDVGSGRIPALPPTLRPSRCRYAGLDISPEELENAPAGSYDATIVSDITCHNPDLDGAFDLIVSWQTLEHVQRVDRAIANLRRYLRPGGRAVIQLSGSFSIFALFNRALPSKLGSRIVGSVMGRSQDTVFRAHYHRCYCNALEREFLSWSAMEILPRFRGAEYLTFSPTLQSIYIAYENWAARRVARNLATHYLIAAVK
jgi:SAM-dependent methyltransferase